MKTKLMWIPFIPLFVGGVLLRVYQAMFDPKGADTGLMAGGAITLGFAAIVIVTILVLAVMSMLDRRTSAYYDIGKNVPAGIFAIAAGAFLFADAVTSVMVSVDVTVIVDALISVVGGVSIIIMGISSFSGNNKAKDLSGLMVMPALWGFARTFLTFLRDKTISPESRDMTDIVYMVLMTLFLLNCAMVYINVKGRHAVKACFIYGMPAILVSTAYTLSHTISQMKNGTFSFIENVRTYEFFMLSLFALFFLIELSKNALERSEKEYEEAGIDLNKVKSPVVEFDENIDPESLIELTDDPIMQQAEMTMFSVDEYSTTTAAEKLEQYKNEIYDRYADAEPAEDAAAENEEPMQQEEEKAEEKKVDEEKVDEEHSEENNEPSKTDDGLGDIDLDSINRLISELTGEQ
ncbi:MULTISPECIES: hypothetical protein [unclassified Ruminococcus]|uniref:hypothetical protein n=1 Tax=unclassified Ruminococcus TaxID=2608920 RepID=UPI00210A53EF|nr:MULTISPECIES: hypothetical protein [unclassified Ruminococcus]MCQ4021431.1 hypothetical protein [Ruminococcus sp. zg-924]MCQ4113876.1 hypothetical protein [Ruminococcus sp. zg-921]